jgi:hypothetical protein
MSEVTAFEPRGPRKLRKIAIFFYIFFFLYLHSFVLLDKLLGLCYEAAGKLACSCGLFALRADWGG